MKSVILWCALAMVAVLEIGSAFAQNGGLIKAGPPYNFVSYACIGSDGISHICVGDVRNAAVTQITSGACADTTPDWSFDGYKVAFQRQCGNDSDIYTANADGSGVTQVTTSTLAFGPTWTPTGQIVYSQIVYQGVPPNPVFCNTGLGIPCADLRIINADGTGDAELLASYWTNQNEVSLYNISAHVTPDGATVVFGCGNYSSGSWTDGNGVQVCAIPLATGNVTQTPTLLTTVSGAASSDPSVGLLKIGGQYKTTFSGFRPTISGNLNVYSMNLDGTGVVQLTNFVEPTEGQDAGWSPDMSMVSFEGDKAGGDASVWVMNADGSNERDTGISCNPNGCKPRFLPFVAAVIAALLSSPAEAQTAPPWGPNASPTNANWISFWSTKQDVTTASAPSSNTYTQALTIVGAPPALTTGSCSASGAVGGPTAGTFVSPSCASGTIILSAMPSAPNGYACSATDRTHPAILFNETASSVNSATFTLIGTATNLDVVQFSCAGY